MSRQSLSRLVVVFFIAVMPVAGFATPSSNGQDVAGAPAVSRRSLKAIPQVVGKGQASTIMFAAGSAQQLGLEPGSGGTLRDAQGNVAGHLQVALDGSLYVSNSGYTTFVLRTVIAAEVYTFSDGQCTYTSIFIQWSDGTSSWTHYTDCTIIVR